MSNPAVRELREVFPDVKETMGEDQRKQVESLKQLIQDPRVRAVFEARRTLAQTAH